MICTANQMTGFYMRETLAITGLIRLNSLNLQATFGGKTPKNILRNSFQVSQKLSII